MSPSKDNWPAPFWDKVNKDSGSECWLWAGAVDPKTGYGKLSYPPRTRSTARAHRISWHLATGRPLSDAAGLDICHTCDVRTCVNPDHLFLGTRTDNMRDAANKGRVRWPGLRGEKHPRAKLTEAQVIEIRNSTESTKALSYKFGASYVAVSQARAGRSWKHLPITGEA